MINEQIMADTVSRLLEAGIDDATIISTLVDAGLTNEDAVSEVQKVKNAKSSPSSVQAVDDSENSANISLIKNQIAAQAEAHDLHQTITASAIEEHEDKIANISSQIEQVKANISSPASTDATLSYRVSQLELKLEEVNSATKAALDLLQKILETNRKILTDLEAGK